MKRQRSFIDSYTKSCEDKRTSLLYAKWCAVQAISIVLGRRCYMISDNRIVYPNFYVILTGPAGAGKTTAMLEAQSILIEMLPDNNMGQYSTPENVINKLSTTCVYSYVDGDTGKEEHQSLGYVFVSELNSFIKPGDDLQHNLLTDLWDCGDYTHSTKTNGTDVATNIFFSLTGGAVAKNLKRLLPREAADAGFTARTIIVYNEQVTKRPPNVRMVGAQRGYLAKEAERRFNMLNDLKSIQEMAGEFLWTKEAAAALSAWNNDDPIDHPAFETYNERRILHCMKLCVIFSADRASDKIITLEDFQKAISLLRETEKEMTKAVQYVTDNDQIDTLNKAVTFLRRRYEQLSSEQKKLGVPEAALQRFLSSYMKPQEQQLLYTNMKKQMLFVEIKAEGSCYLMPDYAAEAMAHLSPQTEKLFGALPEVRTTRRNIDVME